MGRPGVVGVDSWTGVLQSWGVPALVVGVVVLLVAAPKVIEGIRAVLGLLVAPLRLLTPALLGPAARAEQARRRRVATVLLSALDLTEERLGWRGERYTEIRAAIESVDTPRRTRGLFGLRTGAGTYRTRSLEAAFRRERAAVVHLHGSAGSGKSVILRRYARDVLVSARDGAARRRPLALYVSLRDLDLPPEQVTATVLQDYVARQVNPHGSVELAEYLSTDLPRDLREGQVVLLFDSFDEIPAVIASATVDRAVRPYVELITSYLGGGRAHCVVASREYRGPRVPGWARLEISPLARAEQLHLLSAYGLSGRQIRAVEHLLHDVSGGFTTHLRNPMYLSLFALYVLAHGGPPDRASQLFEEHLRTRLDAADPKGRPEVLAVLLEVLERLALRSTRAEDSGLCIELAEIRREAHACARGVPARELVPILVASGLLVPTTNERYAFAHRLIREYVVGGYLVRHPDEVPVAELVEQPRWRETTVALLQVGEPEHVAELLVAIWMLLDEERRTPERFEQFSPRAVHLLELLVTAYGAAAGWLPDLCRTIVGGLIARAWDEGGISERKFALDCLTLLPTEHQPWYVEQAFSGSSTWLRMTALRRCALFSPLPVTIEMLIRRLLVTLLAGGQLSADRVVIDSDLRRLYEGTRFVRTRRVLVALPVALAGLCALKLGLDLVQFGLLVLVWPFGLLTWVLLPAGSFWLLQSSQPLSLPTSTRTARFFQRAMDRVYGWNDRTDSAQLFLGIVVVTGISVLIQFVLAVAMPLLSAEFTQAAIGLATGPLLVLYLYLWAPAVLNSTVNRPLGSAIRVRELFFAPLFYALRAVRVLATDGRPMAFDLAGSLARMVLIGAAAYGASWLIVEFAGVVGIVLLAVVVVLVLAGAPIAVARLVIGEIRSRRAVRRGLRRTTALDEAVLLAEMSRFTDPLEVVDYLRALRVDRTEQARALRREFVQDLIRAVERSADTELDALPVLLGEGGAAEHVPVPVLRGWRVEVLDELGRLSEFLTER
ncbi:hypothetical protein KALB_7049 [Kutzneria albida DSM 43870]|uniref:NACHT domain-containing protein n=1 Tax=Kutzneria albida DSM 43870 TaxID=1449976 RepID=W5WII5_9PSEU|nr:hypothetical protein KALB_7049 [Kutzneria albida DSM 43870]